MRAFLSSKIYGVAVGVLFFCWLIPTVQGAIIDVNAASAYGGLTSDDRNVVNLYNYTMGMNQSTGVYSPWNINGGPGWVTAMPSGGNGEGLWLAFELTNATDIASMSIWNLGSGGDIAGRDTDKIDMYYLTQSGVNALAAGGNGFSTYFANASGTTITGQNLVDLGFTLAQSDITLNTHAATGGYANAVAVSADDAKWVVFTNFSDGLHYSPNNAYYIGLGKVAFLDESPYANRITPVNAAARSTAPTDVPERDGVRSATNLISGRGLTVPNIFDSNKRTHSYTNDQANTSWVSNSSAGVQQWLAFDLGDGYDLEGLHAWNYTRSGLNSRGIQDFTIYTATADDIAGLSFDSYFTEGATLESLILGGFLQEADSFTMSVATGNTAGEQEFLFQDMLSDIAWVLLAIDSNYGDGAYTGLGQIQFMGSLSDSGGGGNVPEPATWVLMVLGLGGLFFVVNKNNSRERK